jgi:hypothetical protein
LAVPVMARYQSRNIQRYVPCRGSSCA